ncbi:ankyrin repeat domain-containing protein [Wolbachia endosymbiont (group B) of Anania hortulata]|uniref:ankyrin repeat domain-containing protein n=1 Tax=Wolbachia endosymbiont (group B) of Anania hortulata TaxID=3139312 RepID=UPI003CCAB155
MVIEKEKFFEIINEVGKSEGLNKDNLLKRIESKLRDVNSELYRNYNDLKVDKMFGILDSGKIVNYTLLHFAVECNSVLIVKLLLEKGVKVINEPIRELDGVKSKLTALHIAASRGHQEVIQLLLDAGTNPLLKNSEDKTPRAMVCNMQNGDIIIKMLETGEQLYADARGKASGRYSLLQPNNEASEDYRNDEQTSSDSIIENSINKVGDTLEREEVLKLQEEEQQDESETLVQSILEDGGEINTRDQNGRISLHHAAVSNDLEVVKYLVENGANVNAQDKDGRSVLHYAPIHMNIEIVKYLIKKGANVEEIDKDGRTPLHFAIACSDLGVAKFLIKEGANVNAQDKDGQSILHYAATQDNIEIVKYLIKKGADVEVQDGQKRYPSDIANMNNCTKIAEFLQEAIKNKRNLKKKKKTRSTEGGTTRSNDQLNLSNGSNDKVKMLGVQSLKEERKELTRLKNCIVEHENRLEVLDKLSEENQSLKQQIQDLKSKNTTLNSELSKTKANKVLLEKTEKRQLSFLKVASVNLVTMLTVGVIFSVAFQLPILSMIAISVMSSLIVGGVTYALSPQPTELKEVSIQCSMQHDACKT